MDDTKWLMVQEIPRLRRYALSLVRDPVAADDLVQDCLERAIRKRHLWSRRGSLRSWLYRILYNVFLNQAGQRNKARRDVEIDEGKMVLSQTATQERRLVCRDVSDAMQCLPDEQRAALALTVVEGLSYDEASSVLGIPIGTLRSRLARGRESLRVHYIEEDAPPLLRRVK